MLDKLTRLDKSLKDAYIISIIFNKGQNKTVTVIYIEPRLNLNNRDALFQYASKNNNQVSVLKNEYLLDEEEVFIDRIFKRYEIVFNFASLNESGIDFIISQNSYNDL